LINSIKTAGGEFQRAMVCTL